MTDTNGSDVLTVVLMVIVAVLLLRATFIQRESREREWRREVQRVQEKSSGPDVQSEEEKPKQPGWVRRTLDGANLPAALLTIYHGGIELVRGVIEFFNHTFGSTPPPGM